MPLLRPFCACLLWGALSVFALADERSQVIVLRNGNVLRGAVEQAGEYLRITSAGSEVHLRSRDVDFLSPSVTAAYEQLRTRNDPPTALGHMQLAAWCVRQELWEPAQIELASARQLEPNHPRLAIMEQTLDHLRKVANEPPRPASEAAPDRNSDSVKSATEETATLLADLPKEALEDFTRRVQPILVNNCTTSGCHQINGPQNFQLNRDLLHGMANRRSTLRNLTATLALIDSDQPPESQLLAIASASHGGRVTPPLPPHQRELHKRLEDWAWLVAGKKPPKPKTPDAKVQLAGGTARKPGTVVPASATEPTEEEIEAAVQAAFGHEEPAASSRPTVRVGAQLKQWIPRDEFDPEIFNRQQQPPVESLPAPE